ncbi:MAG: hypothetical protein EA358_05210 [Flavobacteriales bacterium]|nr:MAG: hypothetical protein EA358_05210 [Flavobacteriales bacterium]
MKKSLLLFLVMILGTSCQVYKKSHTSGYTFKLKPIEKKNYAKKNAEAKPAEFFAAAESTTLPLAFPKIEVAVEELKEIAFRVDLPEVQIQDINTQESIEIASVSEQALPVNKEAAKRLTQILSSTLDLYDTASESDQNATKNAHWASVLGFTFSLLGLILIFTPIALLGLLFVIGGLIFSIIGLTSGGEGRGLAIAGIVLSAVSLLLLVLAVIIFAALISNF